MTKDGQTRSDSFQSVLFVCDPDCGCVLITDCSAIFLFLNSVFYWSKDENKKKKVFVWTSTHTFPR